mmetsp:Transcript_35656/g.86317  ORF Transcript_35656/g.86317 Transcript_35656/m.86317 type:complete len:326 (+) Transcript_35656:35-1012(+)
MMQPLLLHKPESRRIRSRLNRKGFQFQRNPSLHCLFLIVFSHCCVILLLSSPATALSSAQTSRSPGWRSAFKIISRQNSSSSSSGLHATLSFSGDASYTLEMKDATVESVSEFLQSPRSDVYLLGTSNIAKQEDEEKTSDDSNKKSKKDDEGQLWECKQPVVDFMGLKLQPVFINKVRRVARGHVVVSIEDARTDIMKASRNPANRALTSILKSSTFAGESVFTVQPRVLNDDEDSIINGGGETNSLDDDDESSCMLSIELRLTLLIPLPSYMPIPPGFNSLGSAIVRRTGKSRTKRLLQRLQAAYHDYYEEEKGPSLSIKSVSD